MKRGLLALAVILTLFGAFFAFPQKNTALAVPADASEETQSVLDTVGSGNGFTTSNDFLSQIGLGGTAAAPTATSSGTTSATACSLFTGTPPLPNPSFDLIGCVIGIVGKMIGEIFANLFTLIIGITMTGVNGVAQWGNNLLSDPTTVNHLQGAGKVMRNAALSLLTLAILIIAFANILGIDKQKYQINRMIPRLFATMFLVFFSYAIAAAMLSFINGLTDLIMAQMLPLLPSGNIMDVFNGQLASTGGGLSLLAGVAACATPATAGPCGIGLLLFAFIFIVIPGTALMILLAVRVFMLFFLIALSPMAAMMNLLPFTEKYYTQWWGEFLKWAFMGMLAQLVLLLCALLIQGLAVSARPDLLSVILMFVVVGVSFGMAFTIPLSMGGKIAAGIGSAASAVTGAAKGAIKNEFMDRSGLGDHLANRKINEEKRRAATRRNTADMLVKNGGRFGKLGQAYHFGKTGDLTQEEEAYDRKISAEKEAAFSKDHESDSGAALIDLLDRGNLNDEQELAILKLIHKDNEYAFKGPGNELRLAKLAKHGAANGMGGMVGKYAADMYTTNLPGTTTPIHSTIADPALANRVKFTALAEAKTTDTSKLNKVKAKVLLQGRADGEQGAIDAINLAQQWVANPENAAALANAQGSVEFNEAMATLGITLP